MLERVWRKGNSPTLLVGMQISAATMRNSMEVPYKIKNMSTIWPRNFTPRYISPKPQKHSLEKTHHFNVHGSTIYNSQDIRET